ncbi:hypothetical protein C2S51_036156 [Perilla frutescens var. frutescens]|nr:hypothetical protein C2S51_036156 [Perilla frutescens var. frutescens]
MFPQLKEVDLFELPNLTTFCQGIEGIEFPLLTEMSIQYCRQMTSMVSSNENKSGGSNNADIDDGHSLHLFCQPQKVSFGNLKKLRTHRNPFSCGHIIDASLFIRLKKLDISKCEGTMSLFSSSIARNLVSLKALKISDCDELVQMIKDDEEEKAASGGQRTILLFPKLQELELEDLPKLVSICEWKCDVELPSLKEVEIHRCPNMKYFMLGFLAAPNLQVFKTDLDNYLEGSTSLFTSSTAENLVSLRELSIGGCDEMVKVIEDEEEKEKEEEKVVISAAAQRTTLLFSKLQKLQLWDLPKLVSFCEWEFDVEFPSLREVEISECAHMKHFTLGLLTTPNLEVVRINKKYFGGVKDLNDAVQQQFEKKQHEEKEAGAEVQEMEEELNS